MGEQVQLWQRSAAIGLSGVEHCRPCPGSGHHAFVWMLVCSHDSSLRAAKRSFHLCLPVQCVRESLCGHGANLGSSQRSHENVHDAWGCGYIIMKQTLARGPPMRYSPSMV